MPHLVSKLTNMAFGHTWQLFLNQNTSMQSRACLGSLLPSSSTLQLNPRRLFWLFLIGQPLKIFTSLYLLYHDSEIASFSCCHSWRRTWCKWKSQWYSEVCEDNKLTNFPYINLVLQPLSTKRNPRIMIRAGELCCPRITFESSTLLVSMKTRRECHCHSMLQLYRCFLQNHRQILF